MHNRHSRVSGPVGRENRIWRLLMVMCLGCSIMLMAIDSEAKVRRSVVVVRVPRVGPFIKPDDDEEWTAPLTGKLSEEEIASGIRIGRKLRELYIRATRLIPAEYVAEKVHVTSADSIRAAQAAQAVGIGLYEPDSGDRVTDLIPVRQSTKEVDDLLQPCQPVENEDQQGASPDVDSHNVLSLDALNSLWSDFSRFFRVQDAERIEIGDWTLESALATLLSSSPASRDEALLAKARSLGRTMSGLKFRSAHPARLAHQMLLSDVVRSAAAPLHIYVVESDEIMVSLVRAFTFLPQDAVTLPFPLPKSLVLELHDEDEIDPRSGITFVRVLQDFAPVTCSEQGEFYCEYEAFVQSAAPWMLSEKQYLIGCRNLHFRTAAASTGVATTTAPSSIEEIPSALSNKDDLIEERRLQSSTVQGMQSKEHSSAEGDRPCVRNAEDTQSSEGDEFIHGFLVGCILIGSIVACTCRGGKRHQSHSGEEKPTLVPDRGDFYGVGPGEGFEEARAYSDMDAPAELQFPEDGLEGGEVLPSMPKAGGGVPLPPSTKMSSSLIAHIPRPKPTIGPSSSATNSPLIS